MIETVKRYLTGPAFREALKRAGRTFAYAFAGVLIPGLLGWLHAITAWAEAQGQVPFPDGTGLVYLAISATVAGVIAAVNLVGIVLEDAVGKAPGRESILGKARVRRFRR